MLPITASLSSILPGPGFAVMRGLEKLSMGFRQFGPSAISLFACTKPNEIKLARRRIETFVSCTKIANRTLCLLLDIGRLSLTGSASQAGAGAIAALSHRPVGGGSWTHIVRVAVISSI